MPDRSNGYEGIASIYIAGRGRSISGVGALEVAEWSRELPPGASVLDLGCGTGVPISLVLIERGFSVYGIDASASMIAAFHERFPQVPAECAAVENSGFFDRSFEAVVSWGLWFLLDAEVQRKLIAKAAAHLLPGGRFLFTAPSQVCSWQDAMTEQTSISLGRDAYCKAFEEEGLALVGTRRDAGENHYYDVRKI